ncbi:hypothetical protein BFS06_12545 [Clostridium perfringens]|uniref:hypothetical protein n=1 Tax=Clostridium perfringens TaxID=1502 RepID=UPI00103AF9B2|nr:hypothetical protein [Clostridium perfringens]TBX15030.1 hypothetical protein BFS06_12545 [Clostridium perfringens]
MEKVLQLKLKLCKYIYDLIELGELSTNKGEWYKKRIKRLELKLKKIKVDENAIVFKEEIKFKNQQAELKSEIKKLSKELFDKKYIDNMIVNKKLIAFTNNKCFNCLKYNDNVIFDKYSLLNEHFFKANCDDADTFFYNYFTEIHGNSISSSNKFDLSYFKNQIVKEYNLDFDLAIIDFLDYNFFRKMDMEYLFKAILKNKAIGDLNSKNISLKKISPSIHISKLIDSVISKKYKSIYELKLDDLKIIFLEVDKL